MGNHYLLSERQRLALVRGVSPEESIKMRRNKEVKSIPTESVVYVDGFNTIITLEVALSESLLLKCMDAPVSNSGRLKQKIMELLSPFSFEVQAEVTVYSYIWRKYGRYIKEAE